MKVSYDETKLGLEGFTPFKHLHKWISGSGFYIKCCVTYEEPNYYPPNGLIQLEVCPDCGAVRLPNGAESWPLHYVK